MLGARRKGEAGVVRMLELLEDEVIRSLGLLGVTRFAELTSPICIGGADQPAPRPQRLPAPGDRAL